MPQSNQSELTRIIPPEIKHDEFCYAILELARSASLRHVLEIGSSAGEGSTEAFVRGLRENPGHPALHCMEVSKERVERLRQRYADLPFVNCHHTSSVSRDHFCGVEELQRFYQETPTTLNNYPLDQVLGWLQQDLDCLRDNQMDVDGIERIKADHGIDQFDMVLIDGSEFTGQAELAAVYGATYILLDDINAFKNYANYQRLERDSAYMLVRENWSVRNGYAIFKRVASVQAGNVRGLVAQELPGRRGGRDDALPIHFFTIVLNGEPFIRHHIGTLESLSGPWHWHIVEGIATLTHDTAWSVANGGEVSDDLHIAGLSRDGTTAYLDELSRQFPEQISVYRKPAGHFWDGKLEMVNAPLANISAQCLLWQLDVDEIWTAEQIEAARRLFAAHPEKSAALYWCWYFVGPRLLISTRNCYAQNPSFEWLRTWRYRPGMCWAAHEPPTLVQPQAGGGALNVSSVDPFSHAETEAAGLVFQHYAYVTAEQLRFKERYYGYRDALSNWARLQAQTQFPVPLADYFPWVTDHTEVNTCHALRVTPLLARIFHRIYRNRPLFVA